MSVDILQLAKAFELNLEKAEFPPIPFMATKLAVDRSGSMHEEFKCGWVDRTIELFLAAAMKFDDDKQLELGFFNNYHTPVANLTSIPKGGVTKHYRVGATGGTSYTPSLNEMVLLDLPPPPAEVTPIKKEAEKGFFSKLFGSAKEEPAAKEEPVPIIKKESTGLKYYGMVTDGDAGDFGAFASMVGSIKNTFIQIIVIGNQVTMENLTRLKAKHAFVDVIHFPNPHQVDTDAFFTELCNPKFKAWIQSVNSTK